MHWTGMMSKRGALCASTGGCLILISSASSVMTNASTPSERASSLLVLRNEKDVVLWKAWGMMNQGGVLALTGTGCETSGKLR